jgi:hypothetical protein
MLDLPVRCAAAPPKRNWREGVKELWFSKPRGRARTSGCLLTRRLHKPLLYPLSYAGSTRQGSAAKA